MKTVQAILPAILIFLSLVVTINPVSSGATVVKVDPPLVEYHTNATGQQFTVAIKIVDVTNLYGFDIKFRWNTTFLDYTSNSIHVPRDTYPDGVLWNPIIPIQNEVNTTAGTYWIAYTSRWPAPSFNGSGTVFTMTFTVKYHPPQSTANIKLELYETNLADVGANPIPHAVEHGTLVLYALPTNPGDINHDGTVDIFDIVIVALEFGHPPPPIVDLRADVNKDGLVDIFDIVVVALHFGETG